MTGNQYITDDGQPYTHHEIPSQQLQPLVLRETTKIHGVPVEFYENDLYCVTVRRYRKGFFIGNKPYITLGIINADNSARHDWREFQQIKNQICGEEWEAIELYPSESRLRDPSNEFFLWAVPPGVLKFGLEGGRKVLHPAMAIAPQRPFPSMRNEA